MKDYKISENMKVFVYILGAYLFSIAIRLIWVYQFNGYENFMWNHQFMINTNDGYFWAQGARDLIRGFATPHSGSPLSAGASLLTYWIYEVLPFSLETVIFYMPAFLSSLLVIPMILIAKSINKSELGLIAALLASITWSYYNRTMVGYYDTDMLNIVLPVFLLWSLTLAFRSQEEKYLIFTALEIIIYRWWYPQSYSLEFAFFGLILLYTLIYKRKSIYHYKLLAIMLFAMMGLPSLVRLVIVVVVYMAYKSKKLDTYIYYLLAFALVLFFLSGGFSPIWTQLKGYVFKDATELVGHGMQLHFFSVMQTVREAGHIPFTTFANRISGDTLIFFFSLFGYIWFCFRYPVMLLGLPLLGLGFLAHVGGLRFTIYAVPVMAFGAAFAVVTLSEYLKKFLVEGKSSFYIRAIFVSVVTLALLYPNIMHVIGYKVPTVFSKQEVTVLDKLKHVAHRKDYALAWWDYGYPLRYYSDVKTLIDGGKHSGDVNFPVSYILTNPQNIAAKLARLDVEYTEKSYHLAANNPDINRTNMEKMTLDYGFHDTNDFLASLDSNITLPKKTRDIYFFLPFRMLGIFPTVARFSDMDLMSGNTIKRPFFYQTNRFKDSGDILNLGSNVLFNKKNGTLKVGNETVPIKDFYVTAYEKNGKLIRQKQMLHPEGKISIIYMRSYNIFLVLDDAMLHSSYIQLFVFENYDKNLFEPILLSPSAKIYKLKI
ncbi:STT3 domain-containing protein [Sulfurospirillum sp. 1612]|uniref:STT3 domain-containing protein n=1 Tax=Sulfurospirillum sp. 1612 TaxID=3094835 RepID=UPI002F95F09B